MSHAKHSSFLELTEPEIETYLDSILKDQTDGSKRRVLLNYVSQVAAKDAQITREKHMKVALTKRILDKYEQTHAFEYTPAEFAVSAGTVSAQIGPLLGVAHSMVFLPKGTALSGDLSITADSVTVQGREPSGFAADKTLECTTTITGCLRVSGNNCKVSGVYFLSNTARDAVAFVTSATNLTLEDCVFDGSGYAGDASFWFGENYAGSITLKNCWIKNYSNWLLMDGNTHSTTPTTRLTTVTVEKNRFDACAGSIAFRGMQANASDLATIKDNVFAYTTQHQWFWSTVEVNNFKRVVVQGNVVTGAARIVANERGFAQIWSKAGEYVIQMSGNQVDGFDYVLQCACSATFYAPNSDDDRFTASSAAGAVTDTLYGASFVYPWDTGSYAPVNSTRFPSTFSTSWADGLQNR